MKKLYVLRHGETNYNIEGRYQGQIDIPLNETGKKQAEAIISVVKELGINLIITTSLERARETTRIINVQNIPVHIDDAFIERGLGVYEGLTRQEASERYPEVRESLNSTRMVRDRTTPEGETATEVKERIFPKLKALEQRVEDTILIVTHNFAAKIIHFYFNPEITDEDLLKFQLKNCEIKEYKIKK